MIFSPDLAAKISDGTKTVTRRPLRPGKPCRYKVDGEYAVQLSRGGFAVDHIRVTGIKATSLGHLTVSEASLEGFSSAEGFVAKWVSLYGAYAPESSVWRIEFELVES